MVEQAIEKIRKQQGKIGSPVWMVGEQLIDMCRLEAECAALITQDLDNEALSLMNAEKKIKAYADAHKTGNFACVPPLEADRILREFYGLPRNTQAPKKTLTADTDTILNLEDFFGDD